MGQTGSTGVTGATGPGELVGTGTIPATTLALLGCVQGTATVSGVTSAYAGHRVSIQNADGSLPQTNTYYAGAVSSTGAVQIEQCDTLSLLMTAKTVRVYVSQN
jgi:hypothetical protein